MVTKLHSSPTCLAVFVFLLLQGASATQPPRITGINPSHLGTNGGTAITIRGIGLVGPDDLLPSVTIGGAPCVVTFFSRSSPSDQHLSCISPKGPEDPPDSEHVSKARPGQVALDVALTTATNQITSACCPRKTDWKKCQRSNNRSFTAAETCYVLYDWTKREGALAKLLEHRSDVRPSPVGEPPLTEARREDQDLLGCWRCMKKCHQLAMVYPNEVKVSDRYNFADPDHLACKANCRIEMVTEVLPLRSDLDTSKLLPTQSDILGTKLLLTPAASLASSSRRSEADAFSGVVNGAFDDGTNTSTYVRVGSKHIRWWTNTNKHHGAISNWTAIGAVYRVKYGATHWRAVYPTEDPAGSSGFGEYVTVVGMNKWGGRVQTKLTGMRENATYNVTWWERARYPMSWKNKGSRKLGFTVGSCPGNDITDMREELHEVSEDWEQKSAVFVARTTATEICFTSPASNNSFHEFRGGIHNSHNSVLLDGIEARKIDDAAAKKTEDPTESPTEDPTESPTEDPAPTSQYDVKLVYTNGVTTTQRAAFTAAKARWERVITGDIPGTVNVPGGFKCGAHTVPGSVSGDDLVIFVRLVPIDGLGNILGSAGPCAITHRQSGFIPRVGVMQFDTADLAKLEADGSLEAVIMHEMVHVIGIGTMWNTFSLVDSSNPSDLRYTGDGGIRGQHQIGGAGTPKIYSTGGPGSRGGHWDEPTYPRELMSPHLTPGAIYLSRLTIQSLTDMGYVVNPAEADAYTIGGRRSDDDVVPPLHTGIALNLGHDALDLTLGDLTEP